MSWYVVLLIALGIAGVVLAMLLSKLAALLIDRFLDGD